MSIEDLWHEFAWTGVTLQSFKLFVTKSLQVPILYMGNAQVVRVETFKLAMLAITRIGEESFLAPGSAGTWTKRKRERGFKTNIDVATIEKNLTNLLAEMLYSERVGGREISLETIKLAREVARRMLMAGMASATLKQQAEQDKANLARMKEIAGPTPGSLLDAERTIQGEQDRVADGR